MSVHTSSKKIASPLTTDGDILIYNSGSTRLGIGTNDHLLTSSSGLPGYLAAPTGGASGGFTHGQKTRLQIQAISSPTAGDTAYCTDYDKICFYTGNSWQIEGETFEAIAEGDIDYGEVVHSHTGVAGAVEVTTTANSYYVSGVCAFPATDGNYVSIAFRGIHEVKTVTTIVSYGIYLYSSTTSGAANAAGTSPSQGTFGLVVETGSSYLARTLIRETETV